MSSTAIETDLHDRFAQLRDQWKSESRYLSNTAQMAMLWPYQQIIGMGPAVVPLILTELHREPDHWFWALQAITGHDPIESSDWGDLCRMTDAWLEWADQNGIIY